MCGICGKVYLDPSRRVLRPEVEVMRDTMFRRGPDASGLMLDRHVGLGHRRLSIIDLESSAQPMSNEDGTIWIVFNGEIYNYQELRAELRARGHVFKTSGDTEVIIHLYEELGASCVTRLRGMFAFAIWDSRFDTLLLARDRLGVKPLLYYLDNEVFLFASELKAIAADAQFRRNRQIDPDAVHAYLSFLCVPDPISIYQGVQKLPAGHTLEFRRGHVHIHRYWNVTFTDGEIASEDEWIARLEETVREAVRIRLVADVPLGAFLSGGIDSSTVVAFMTTFATERVKTFSIGFDDLEHDEASDARKVASHLGTDHTEIVLAAHDARDLIPPLLAHFDEPFADSSAIPTYFVSRLAGQKVTVVLSGDGGDELFGGYPWRQMRPRYQRLMSRLPYPVRGGIACAGRLAPSWVPGRNYLRHVHLPYERYIVDAIAVFDDEDKQSLYSPSFVEWSRGGDAYRSNLAHLTRGGAPRSWSARMMEYDLKTYLPNDILTKVDRMSMLASVEARVPLLDHRVVELAARIPSRLKIRGSTSKYILKRLAAPFLPEQVLGKRKHGFSVPLGTWLRSELKDDVLDVLRSGNAHGYFSQRGLNEICDGFFRGSLPNHHQLFALFAFEVWYRDVHCSAEPRRPDSAWAA